MNYSLAITGRKLLNLTNLWINNYKQNTTEAKTKKENNHTRSKNAEDIFFFSIL